MAGSAMKTSAAAATIIQLIPLCRGRLNSAEVVTMNAASGWRTSFEDGFGVDGRLSMDIYDEVSQI